MPKLFFPRENTVRVYIWIYVKSKQMQFYNKLIECTLVHPHRSFLIFLINTHIFSKIYLPAPNKLK